MSFQQSLQAWTRPSDWKQPGMLRAAKFLHRAKAAFGSTRDADHGPKIHKRGIENAGVFMADQPCSQIPYHVSSCGRITRNLNIEKSRHQAGNIRIDDGDRLIESETRDGIRGVTTHPRMRLK